MEARRPQERSSQEDLYRKLIESERRFREMLEEIDLIAVILDNQGKITFANDFLLELTGWKREDALGKDWFSIFLPPEQRERVRKFFFESIKKGEIQPHFENEIITSQDERRTIFFTNVLLRDPLGNVTGTASVGEDVTERKRAAEEIKESRKEVLDILESISDGFFALDNDWRFTYVNRKAEELVRIKKEGLFYRYIWDVFPEAVKLIFYKELTRSKEEMVPVVFEGLFPPLNKWFEVRGYPYKNGLSIYFSDITERKKEEEEREHLAKRTQLLLDSTDEGIYGLDTEGRCFLYNKAACRMTGYEFDEILGKNIHGLIHHTKPDGTPYPLEECPVVRALKVGQGVRIDTEVFWRKDGTSFPVEYSSYPIIEDGKTTGGVVTFTDITERKLTEAKLKRAKELSDALNRINTTINSTLDFDEIMQGVIVESAKALGADAASIALRENGRWIARYLHGAAIKKAGTVLTGREVKYAEDIVKARKPIAVSDAFTDPRVDNELMISRGVRSVLAIPLIAKGDVIGVMRFVYRTAPMIFTDTEIDFADKLAISISLATENARIYMAERNIADTLQEALLTVPEHIKNIEFGQLYRSATEAARVGGDFFDLFEVEHGKVCVVIGDVSGKGLEAATLTSLVKNAIKAYAYESESPASIMQRTNEIVMRASAPTIFVTLFLGILNTETGHLVYCSAGHPPAILKRKSSEISLLITSSPVIGAFAGLNFIDDETTLEKGDTVVLYTDGVTEARCDREFFGDKRLVNFIKNLKPIPTKEMPQAIFNEVMACTGGKLADDIALLCVSLEY